MAGFRRVRWKTIRGTSRWDPPVTYKATIARQRVEVEMSPFGGDYVIYVNGKEAGRQRQSGQQTLEFAKATAERLARQIAAGGLSGAFAGFGGR
jgi:hypothetical protein